MASDDRAIGWRHVSRRDPCPICRKPDWCAISADGEIARCMRVAVGAFKTSTDGGNCHRLTSQAVQPFVPLSKKPEASRPAPVETRDRVYRCLLRDSHIEPRHAWDLQGRGLGDTTIANNLYGSVAEDTDDIVSRLSLTVGEILGTVPGFVRRNGHWHLMANRGDLLIPCRNERGLIVGILRRTDDPSRKYAWLSSAPTGGPGPGKPLPLHFASPHRVEINHTPLIVEGVLKADVTADLSGFAVVGLPSVSAANSGTVETLLRALPAAHRWGIALDQDKRTNHYVRDAETRLIAALRAADQSSFVLDWKRGKGPDDFLAEVRCA